MGYGYQIVIKEGDLFRKNFDDVSLNAEKNFTDNADHNQRNGTLCPRSYGAKSKEFSVPLPFIPM